MSTPTSEPLTIARPALAGPVGESDKYRRGKVVVVSGAMAGAAHLAAIAAMRSGAGYVELAIDPAEVAPPYALVRRSWDEALLDDPRVGAVAIGPGLVDDAEGRTKLEAALAAGKPAVLDAGALAIARRIGFVRLKGDAPRVLTPHAGEFARLFGAIGEDRVAAARAAAARSGAVVLLKGERTVVAAPDGRVAVNPPAPAWLATAGTGDVLTGIVATMLAQADVHGFDAFAAAGAAVWLHARAAALAGPVLIADDLLVQLPRAVAEALAGA